MRRALLAPAAVALAALGTVSGPTPPPVTPLTSDLFLRVAFMMGSRGEAPLPIATRAPFDAREFDGWDPTADNPELIRLLDLKQLVELSRAIVTMPVEQPTVSLTVVGGKKHYGLGVEAVEVAGELVQLAITLTEDGRAFSQPKMTLRLGQKGVACARVSRGPSEAFVFFVLQLDRLQPRGGSAATGGPDDQ